MWVELVAQRIGKIGQVSFLHAPMADFPRRTAVFLAKFTAIQLFVNDRKGLCRLYFPLMYFTEKLQFRCSERD
jgi:hypothetical protein